MICLKSELNMNKAGIRSQNPLNAQPGTPSVLTQRMGKYRPSYHTESSDSGLLGDPVDSIPS